MGIIAEEIEPKLAKGNQILFTRDNNCLQKLLRLIEAQNHRVLVAWALDCAKVALANFERACVGELRPAVALQKCEEWAKGNIKMLEAKRAILDAHAVAKITTDKYLIALVHAIGQAGSTVHVETHAMGLVVYELTAVVHENGLSNCEKAIENKIEFYCDKLLFWQNNISKINWSWAGFISADNNLNKEKILHNKKVII